MEWIDEGKPKPYRDDEEDDVLADLDGVQGRDATVFPARVAPIFQQSARASERPKTPQPADDLFGDGVPDEDDIYDATPKAPRTAAGPATGGEPDDDELDALMAEEETSRTAPSTSLFGDGSRAAKFPPRPKAAPADDEDDLDALMAEAETQTAPAKPSKAPPPKKKGPFIDDDEDDLDALMAEFEGQGGPNPGAKPPPPPPESRETADADEEEAMAEMEGLW